MELWTFVFVIIIALLDVTLLTRLYWRHVRFSLRALLIALFVLNCGLALIFGTRVLLAQVLGGVIVIVLMAVVFMHLVDAAVQEKTAAERKKIAEELAAAAQRPPDA